ncbi:MAG: glycosyltransferase family 4 protein [Chloroflexi bacterium]|nr:glycosyltransferase family 4 protein [Chloroflexota bacterium]
MRSRYRILFLAPTGFFADYGCHVRIRGQAEALQARGHEVLICTYPGGRDLPGLPTVRPPLWPRGREMPVGSSWLKLALDAALAPTALVAALRFHPHLIHAFLHEGALIGAALARLLRRPLIFDYQGSLTAEMLDHRFISQRSPFLRPLRWLERHINRWPAAVLVSSHHAADLLAEEYGVPASRVRGLPDSVDPAHFRPPDEHDPPALAALRRSLSIPAERRLVVYLGLLAEYQGIDLLLHAARILADDYPHLDPHFLVMGFPFVAHYRRLAAALGLAEQVTFTGKLPYEDAPRYLALGDVAAAPKLSATEGSGKLLTYMATALPVAAFDTPVHREYLGDLGVYAPPGDAAGLAAALAALLNDPQDAARRGRALRQRAMAHYTWAQAAADIEETHEAILCDSGHLVYTLHSKHKPCQKR